MRKSNAPSSSKSRTRNGPTDNSRSFRIKSKSFFLTWPKNDSDKFTVLENVKRLFGDNLTGAVVCREKHQDGTNHLHAIVVCKATKNIQGENGMKSLDELTGKHGNYQSARNWKRVLSYVCKDNDYVSEGIDVEVVTRALKNKRGVTWEESARDIKDRNLSLEDLYNEKPGLVFQYRRRIEDFLELRDRFTAPQLKAYHGIQLNNPDFPVAREVDEWLIKNLRKERQIRQRQLWIYGDPDVGKTRLKCQLMERFKVFLPPSKEEWWCGFDNSYEGIIFDEYEGEKQITELNLVLDGSPCKLKAKGNGAIYKKKNMWVIFLSNLSPSECYPQYAEKNPRGWDGFLERLEVINLERHRLPVEEKICNGRIEKRRYKVNWDIPNMDDLIPPPRDLIRQNASMNIADKLLFRRDVLGPIPVIDEETIQCAEDLDNRSLDERRAALKRPAKRKRCVSPPPEESEESKGKEELSEQPESEEESESENSEEEDSYI